MTSPDALREILLANPETVHLPVAGETRPFLLSVYGCELATAAGHDPVPALTELVSAALRGGRDAVAGAVNTGTLSALATAIWAGLLPFDRTLPLELVKATLTPTSAVDLLKTALPTVMTFASEMTGGATPADALPADAGAENADADGADAADAGAEGKSPAPASAEATPPEPFAEASTDSAA